jgi:aromatic-L-amino-acid decarboxylase
LPEHKQVTDAWAEADSLVINPHKMLFVPLDFSALYVRDLDRLRRLFTLNPEHLHLRDPAGVEINYMDYGVQLGRRFRALKAWVVWRAFGREGMAARIREHVRLAQLFARWVEDDSRFEISAPVMMGVVCFRLKDPDGKAADKKNSETVAKINASGSAYLTQTKLRGRTVMRLGLGNILTTEEHVRRVWEMIRGAV